jgi:hypothetical protein
LAGRWGRFAPFATPSTNGRICALPPSTAGVRLGWDRAAVIAITKNVDGQGTHRRLGNSPRGVASRAASKASLSAVSDNDNLIAGPLAMRAINTESLRALSPAPSLTDEGILGRP